MLSLMYDIFSLIFIFFRGIKLLFCRCIIFLFLIIIILKGWRYMLGFLDIFLVVSLLVFCDFFSFLVFMCGDEYIEYLVFF